MDLMVNPVITDFQQDVNGDIKMLKIGQKKEDAYANIIGQAEGADLDNNKTATINVSTYTEPVEILPTEGKDGMKKATVTLSNIPSMNFFTGTVPGFVLQQENSDPFDVIVVDNDGNFVSTLTDVPDAKFIITMNHGGQSDLIYRKDTTSTIPHDIVDNYVDSQDFTITEIGQTITLSNNVYTITTKELYLNNCMMSPGS